MNYPFRVAALAYLQGGAAEDFMEAMEKFVRQLIGYVQPPSVRPRAKPAANDGVLPLDNVIHIGAEYLPDEKGEIRNRDFFGGNLAGVEEKLEYLQSLQLFPHPSRLFPARQFPHCAVGDGNGTRPAPVSGTRYIRR